MGVAPNKLVAKIASDLRKPDGLVVVRSDEVDGAARSAAGPQIVRDRHTRLRRSWSASASSPCATCDSRPTRRCSPLFGAYAAQLKTRAAGSTIGPSSPDWDEKQISAEETFDIDIADHARLHAELAQLADRMAARLRAQGWLAERVVVKIRRKDFKTYTRQRPIRPATQETRPLASAAAHLLDEWLQEQPRAAIRLLGVGAADLTTAPQLDLFAVPEAARNRHLDAAIDGIRARFGAEALSRASSLRPRR